MPVRETCLHEFLRNLTHQGNSFATAKKYGREAAAFAAWLGGGADGGAGRRVPGSFDNLPHHDWGQRGGIRPEQALCLFRAAGLPPPGPAGAAAALSGRGAGADPEGIQAAPHRRPAEKAGAAAPGHGGYLRYRHPSV